MWDVQAGRELLTLRHPAMRVSGMAFSPDGQRLAIAPGRPGESPTVTVWELRTGRAVLTLKGHSVLRMAYSPDGRRLATGSGDGTVKVWDAQTGAETLTLKGNTYAVLSMAYSPDGHRLASVSEDRTVKIWDATPVPEKP